MWFVGRKEECLSRLQIYVVQEEYRENSDIIRELLVESEDKLSEFFRHVTM